MTETLGLSVVTKAFLFFLCLKALVEAYLDNRNKIYILKNKKAVPEKFQSKISLEDHQKAADYSVAKIQTSRLFSAYNILILLAWTLGGGVELLYQFSHSVKNGMVGDVLFFCLFALASGVLSLPQSLYTTFVIEERFGFNKTTAKLFIVDLLKGILVSALIGIPVIWGILKIMSSLGDLWWVYAWSFLVSIQLILLWAYPTFIAPLFNKFQPLEDGEVKDKILELLSRTGFESNGLFVMDASKRSSHGNAYFTGFGKNKRIVFFDTLIKTLEAREIEAVLAHELGHFKKKHVLKNIVQAIVFSFIGFFILGKLMNSYSFFSGHGVQTISNATGLLLFMLVSGVYTFFTTPVSAWFSRKYEFEADQFASENSNGKDLIQALVKMYKDNASTLTPDPLYSAFYHSHPPAMIRVQFLEKLDSSN